MYKFQKYCYDKLLKEADSKGGTVEYINLRGVYLTELPEFFKDLTVRSYFDVENNQLTSCKNFPKSLYNVYAGVNQIENLDDLHYIPETSLYINDNKISSLEPLSRFGKRELGTLYVARNRLRSLKGAENMKIEAFRGWSNEISSWNFFPKISKLSLEYNKLTTWEGMPSELVELNVIDNWDVKNMNGFKAVEKELYFSSSTLKADDVMRELRLKGISFPNYCAIEPIK